MCGFGDACRGMLFKGLRSRLFHNLICLLKNEYDGAETYGKTGSLSWDILQVQVRGDGDPHLRTGDGEMVRFEI